MYHNCINMISTVGTIYSHSWTVTAYGARHVTDGQTERKERGYMIVLDYRDRRPLYEQVTEKLEELMFSGVLAAMDALDIMCKTADVELASWERKLGGRLVTIIVQGDVAAVTEAVEAAATNAIKKPASYAVIANPHEEIVKMVELSASRWRKKKGDE